MNYPQALALWKAITTSRRSHLHHDPFLVSFSPFQISVSACSRIYALYAGFARQFSLVLTVKSSFVMAVPLILVSWILEFRGDFLFFYNTGFTALKLTPLPLCTDFVDASKVRNLIHLKGYFKGFGNSWDHALDGVMHHDLALCALGGLLGHLSRLKLDDTLRNVDILPYQAYSGCLRMDGQALVNLEIFSNNADGGLSGTLYKYLDNCVTSSGKWLLRNWICHPLKDVQEINNRLM